MSGSGREQRSHVRFTSELPNVKNQKARVGKPNTTLQPAFRLEVCQIWFFTLSPSFLAVLVTSFYVIGLLWFCGCFLYLLFVDAIFAFFLSFWGQFRIFYFVCHAGPSEFSAFHNLTRCSPCCSLNPCLRFLGLTRYFWGPETLQKLWNAALFISA